MIGWVAAAVTALGTGATLALEPAARDQARIAKMLAATGFLVVAVAAGAFDTDFGPIILVGLALSWVGDLLLTFTNRQAFLGGLVAFLLGHVAYVAAFAVRGLSGVVLVVALLGAILVAAAVVPWLLPHVSDDMRVPVLAYVVVISAMLVTAAGTHGSEVDWRIVGGAALFYVSDIFVARDRFVAPGRINRLAGLPLYFAGQLLLAWSAGG